MTVIFNILVNLHTRCRITLQVFDPVSKTCNVSETLQSALCGYVTPQAIQRHTPMRLATRYKSMAQIRTPWL